MSRAGLARAGVARRPPDRSLRRFMGQPPNHGVGREPAYRACKDIGQSRAGASEAPNLDQRELAVRKERAGDGFYQTRQRAARAHQNRRCDGIALVPPHRRQ